MVHRSQWEDSVPTGKYFNWYLTGFTILMRITLMLKRYVEWKGSISFFGTTVNAPLPKNIPSILNVEPDYQSPFKSDNMYGYRGQTLGLSWWHNKEKFRLVAWHERIIPWQLSSFFFFGPYSEISLCQVVVDSYKGKSNLTPLLSNFLTDLWISRGTF